jgi:2-keto-4-pentenoate hydratase/2-oxohepta-3-ene-1,7-dioic acid hydratase in catechol pathway
MKLFRVGDAGQERPAIQDQTGALRDLSSVVEDINGASLSPQRLATIAAADLTTLPIIQEPVRIGPCLARPGKFLCIGLNYADHAAETNAPIPEEPILFFKATTAICGPNDDVIQPRGSTKLDWEVELAFVVGSTCRYLPEAAAEEAIAGYFICHDVSERNFQLERGGTWDKGKGCDTFGPIGPWLATRDEIADPTNLAMWLEVNGRRFQNGSTKTMIFKPAFLISYISQFMTLEPGDIVTTGTPPGVGLGQRPPVYLNPGDVVRLGIQGLGEQQQRIVVSR